MQIDVDSLWRTETELRERVECSPANVEARRDLACCLILLAMYKAGIEKTSNSEELEVEGGRESRSSEQLLLEHLWHAQVLNVLPSARQQVSPILYDLGFGQLVGASLLSTKVKSKYEDAMRRLISDLQDPPV